MEEQGQVINLSFAVTGDMLPVDHGFALYGAISRKLPQYHSMEGAFFRRIPGKYMQNGMLDIAPLSQLIFRIQYSHRKAFMKLIGSGLRVCDHDIRLGVVSVTGLEPKAELYSDLVTTRGGMEEGRFLREIERQMKSLDVEVEDITIHKRKIFSIHGSRLVGYSLSVSGLSEEHSLRLQSNGVGGRRKLGCGFFESLWERRNGNGG